MRFATSGAVREIKYHQAHVRNVSHLGIGQIASTALGILLSAVIGRALEPAQLGILYTVFAISSFAYVIVDWGQGTYLVREMARGRADEPRLIGSALLIRLAAVVFLSAVGVAVALPLGYSGQIVVLALLAMMSGIPATLFAPFSCSFRSKDRMDVDAFVNIVGKATTLVATAIALRLGGGLTEVILMSAVGGLSILLVGAIAALRLDVKVAAPAPNVLRELLRHGAPLAIFSLVIAIAALYRNNDAFLRWPVRQSWDGTVRPPTYWALLSLRR